MNICELLSASRSYYEEKPLLFVDGERWSFDELATNVWKLAAVLRARGLGKGDRIIITMENSVEWLTTLFAVLQIGAVAVPVNPGLRSPEMCNIAVHCEPALAIVDSDLLANFSPLKGAFPVLIKGDAAQDWEASVALAGCDPRIADTAPDETGMIFYTSGTTGAPKGVMISHRAAGYIAEMTSSHMAIGPRDVSLVMGSLAFIYPLAINCLAAIRGGATVVLQKRFHPKLVCDAIREHRVTVTMGVPTMYVMIMNFCESAACDFSTMRLAISGGASLPDALCRRAKQSLGFEIFDLWGMTECTPVTSYDPRRDDRGYPDSCGRALPGCAFRIVNDQLHPAPVGTIGEVMLSGPMIMSGYYRNPEATAQTMIDGWIRSGDLGLTDAEGRLFIVGRKKDLIIRGGANVYPVEIEEVLYSHPGVAECAVVGLPDPVFGERVKAFIVRRSRTVGSEELLAHCAASLADYKLPAEIEFLDELPKGPTGKILRRELRERSAPQS